MSILGANNVYRLRYNVISLARRHINSKNSVPIIHIPSGSKIYAFGTPSSTARPLISPIGWKVREGEAWAVVSGTGGAGKGLIFKTLLGHARLAPPDPEIQGLWAEGGGLYPFLAKTGVDPYTRISYVSFRQRNGGESGAFFDYTARYGAMREEEDRITLRDTLSTTTSSQSEVFHVLTTQMGLVNLLDIPMITLSNGQTRRARIVKAILDQPDLLLLDEPLTGLDHSSRNALNKTLQQLHLDKSPRIIIGMRKGEELPRWITHVLEIKGGIASGRQVLPSDQISHSSGAHTTSGLARMASQDLMVDMKNVNVAYGNRKVLTNINWEIRRGERWHLRGANGSGKTTLLALLTGDHPQSYVQAHLLLPSLTDAAPHPRKKTPTAHLRRLIGVVSPEMFDAFPRRHPGMSVWEAVTTGFDGGFVPRTRDAGPEARARGGVGWVDVADDEVQDVGPKSSREKLREWRIARCWEVLEALGPAAWDQTGQEGTASFALSPFSARSPGEQRLVLLMRALVGRPPLVLLDEVWSGMDDSMVAAARRYLRGDVPGVSGVDETQAVVVITHWEDEVPWAGAEVRQFTLG